MFLLTSAQRRVQRWSEARAAQALGGPMLTPTQMGLLFALGPAEGRLMGEAADALDVAPSALSGLVDRMARAGLVERRRDEADGRAYRLCLTEAGRHARSLAVEGVAELNTRMTEGFSDADLEVVARWLSAVRARFPRPGENDDRPSERDAGERRPDDHLQPSGQEERPDQRDVRRDRRHAGSR
jgi:DNA-binding MarR family transcriptional regulator